jgi:hypothetical protein
MKTKSKSKRKDKLRLILSGIVYEQWQSMQMAQHFLEKKNMLAARACEGEVVAYRTAGLIVLNHMKGKKCPPTNKKS